MTKDRLLAHIDSVIAEAQPFCRGQVMSPVAFGKLQASGRHVCSMLGRRGDPWVSSFDDDKNYSAVGAKMVGTLQSIRVAVAADLLLTVESLLLADVSADLLEQAEHLLSNGYSLAAGVLGRAVLEEHLRKWCERAGCIPAKAKATINDLNSELYAKNYLNKLEMQHVQSMTAVGNDAAHNAGNAKKEDVERLLKNLRDFVTQHPLP